MMGDQRIVDDVAADEVFHDDPLEDRRIALPVPRAFRIDDGDRPALADTKAVGLAAKDAALLGEPELLEPPFQVVPGCETAIPVAALGLGLIAAEEDVAPGDADADRLGNGAL
jgi:hypothetical protein